jgi:pilus assembly protein TadC
LVSLNVAVQQPLSFRRRLTEVVATILVFAIVVAILAYLIGNYNGPLSGAYFDALLASPFLMVAVFFVVAHFELRRFRRSRRLQLQADASS